MSFSLSLRSFSLQALELVGAHDSTLALEQLPKMVREKMCAGKGQEHLNFSSKFEVTELKIEYFTNKLVQLWVVIIGLGIYRGGFV